MDEKDEIQNKVIKKNATPTSITLSYKGIIIGFFESVKISDIISFGPQLTSELEQPKELTFKDVVKFTLKEDKRKKSQNWNKNKFWGK